MRKAGKKMHVILCADDRNGMMFHRRRQSRDRAVLEDIEKLRAGKKLLMNKYSDKMFSEYGYSDHETFESSEAALTAAGEDDFCFLEDISPAAHRAGSEVSLFTDGIGITRRICGSKEICSTVGRLSNAWILKEIHTRRLPGEFSSANAEGGQDEGDRPKTERTAARCAASAAKRGLPD